MTLPASPPITAQDINVELGRAPTAAFDINGAEERALAGVPAGAISFTDFLGKSAVTITVTAGVVDGNGSFTPGGTVIEVGRYAGAGNQIAGLRFGADGNLYTYVGASTSININQLSASTDWVRPEAAIADYTVQLDYTGSTITLNGGAYSSGDPITVSGDQSFYLECPGADPGGTNSLYADGEIVVKKAGVTVLTRDFIFEAESDRS